jgi:hypothetical protein
MSRYIDADKFIRWIDVGHLRSPSEICYCEEDVKGMIDMQPTADVVEVRHGEWETTADATPNWLAYTHICSVCKTSYKDLISKGHNYCHNCGAKMDGERSANNEHRTDN